MIQLDKRMVHMWHAFELHPKIWMTIGDFAGTMPGGSDRAGLKYVATLLAREGYLIQGEMEPPMYRRVKEDDSPDAAKLIARMARCVQTFNLDSKTGPDAVKLTFGERVDQLHLNSKSAIAELVGLLISKIEQDAGSEKTPDLLRGFVSQVEGYRSILGEM